ncbi:tetratricopeptide repeat protein [Comamonas sp. NLF-1-9]|uniref:O-linked N-acetylglucosamine transferase, SPINDLY family protein n=1 Tax=Comamonas sp. NLF-1-9 TaxID=2853163 RepID=UPI0021021FD8|nr:tetratricopeptide repeat protein [Comamonas sp. NLF-1-9]
MKQHHHDPMAERLQAARAGGDWPLLIRLCRQALRKNGRHQMAHRLLGFALGQKGEVDAALQAFGRAAVLYPHDAELLINHANLLVGQERPREALPLLEEVVRLRPERSVCWMKLAQCCYPINLHQRGYEASEHALRCAVDDLERVNALTQRAIHRRELGQIREAVQDCTEAIALAPQFAANHSNRLLFMLADPETSPQALTAAAREFGNTFEPQFKPHWPSYEERRGDPWRRLKVGFISPDFRKHAVMCFAEGILAQLDRRQFEVYGFYTYPQDDNVTERVRCHVDHFIRLHDQDEEQRALTIRRHAIDILVDMSGHTGHHSLLTLARKPAPVQATFIGFVATTGLTAIDYYLTDEVINPPGADALFTETLFRLPTYLTSYRAHSRNPLWRYQPRYAVQPTPALRNGFVTYGSCNNLGKLTDDVLTLWGEILQRTPAARLLIEGKGFEKPEFAADYKDRCAKLGIDVQRLMLVPLDTDRQYLAYHDIDIALDPFPLTGGTTTLDTLWMGVPLVSMEGSSSPARISTEALTYLGRSQWLAKTRDEYLALAIGFAADIEQLNALRLSLRDEVERSPLMRDDIVCPHWADALRTMWLRWQAGLEHPDDAQAQERAVAAWLAACPAHLRTPPVPRVGLPDGAELALPQAHARLQELVERALARDTGKDCAQAPLKMDQCWRSVTEFAELVLSAVPNDPVALACLAEVEHAHGQTEFAVTYLRYATKAMAL